MPKRLTSCLIVVVAAFASSAVEAQAQTVIDLGIDGAMGPGVGPPIVRLALNDQAQVVGRSAGRAALWQNGVVTDLAVALAAASSAAGINSLGQVVGQADGRAIQWQNGVAVALGTLPGTSLSRAFAINQAGEAAGDSGNRAVLFRSGHVVDLGVLLGGTASQAGAINDRSQVAGYSTFPPFNDGPHTVLWNGTSRSDLRSLPDRLYSAGLAINASGQVAGFAFTNLGEDLRAFLWTPLVPNAASGTMVDLGTLGGFQSRALGLNDSGQVVGRAQYDFSRGVLSPYHAFVFFPGVGMKDANELLPPGAAWVLREAHAINNSGQIVGAGEYNGQARSFLLTPAADLAGVVVQPSGVKGGDPSTVRVWLYGPARAGGTRVSLSTDEPALAFIPDHITVPEGENTAIVSIDTHTVAAPVQATLFATLGGTTRQATLSLLPVSLRVSLTGMASSGVLRIESRRDFGGQVGHTTLRARINGTDIITPTVDLTTSPPGHDPTPFDIDLSAFGVPRLTTNQRFVVSIHTELEDGTVLDARREVVILLPVVVVPGIFNGDGGPGSYPDLESFLASASLTNFSAGPGAVYEADPRYPTLFTLAYHTNNDTFTAGSLKLDALIEGQILPATYADRVQLVSQSKGGLVARKYVVSHPERVARFVACSPPNVGSLWAYAVHPQNGFDLRNLYPVWPSFRFFVGQLYVPVPNAELNALNKVPLPGGIPYSIVYAANVPTPDTFTQFVPLGLNYTYSLGDGVVPGESALGIVRDRNPLPRFGAFTIPAFDGVPIESVAIDGLHLNYNEHPDVMQAIFDRLTQDFN